MYATESSAKSNLQAAECFSPSRCRFRLTLPLVCFSGYPRPGTDDVFRLMPRLNHYFRQKSFKSFSCRHRLRAEVDSELFIRCRLCPGAHALRSSVGYGHYFPADRIICNRVAATLFSGKARCRSRGTENFYGYPMDVI